MSAGLRNTIRAGLLALALVGARAESPAVAPAADPAAGLVAARDAALRALDEREAAELDKLASAYRAAMERGRAEAQAKGDLDAVVAWKRELERIDQWPVIQAPAEFSTLPALLAYQQRLASLLQAREEALSPAKRAVLEKHIAAVDDQIRMLVRTDRIDDALRLRPLLEEAKADLAALPAPAPAPAPVAAAPEPGPVPVAPAAPITAAPAPAAPLALPRLLAEISPTAKPGRGHDDADEFPPRWRARGRVLVAQTAAGPAVFMNERDCALEIPPLDTLRVDNRPFTLVFWVFPMTPRRSTFLSIGRADDGHGLRVGNLTALRLGFQAGEDLLESDAAWKPWEWNQVVCVKDPASEQLAAFLNGEPAGVRPASKDKLYNLHHKPVSLGRADGDIAPAMAGLIARARIFEGVLSAAQVTALHAQERHGIEEARAAARAPATTPAQLTASLAGRLISLGAREIPRRLLDDTFLLLRADGSVAGPAEATWKALSATSIELVSGGERHELAFAPPVRPGPRTYLSAAKTPDAQPSGSVRSGFVIE